MFGARRAERQPGRLRSPAYDCNFADYATGKILDAKCETLFFILHSTFYLP
jgi:hypothetical protein